LANKTNKCCCITWQLSFTRKVTLHLSIGDSGDGKLFKDNVYAQVQRYFSGEAKLPRDAAALA
jgi:hypothetical protein